MKLKLKRFHLFEIEDQAWFPKIFRNYITDILGYIAKIDFYTPFIARIKTLLPSEDYLRIVDLCSGSGEPAIKLQTALQQHIEQPIQLTLTDKYPNLDKVNGLAHENICYLSKSIDATNVPEKLTGLRTLFASFHHFTPEKAKMILQNAIDNQMPIAIFEFTQRNWQSLFLMITSIIHLLCITPFIEPFSFKRLFWTYIIPIVPLVYFWDGLISNLRTYTTSELENMVSELDNNKSFAWEISQYQTKISLLKVTYLIGYPN